MCACVGVCACYVFSLVFPLLSARNSTTVAHGLSGIATPPYSNEYGGIWYQTHPLHTVGVMLFQFSKKKPEKTGPFLNTPLTPDYFKCSSISLVPHLFNGFWGLG